MVIPETLYKVVYYKNGYYEYPDVSEKKLEEITSDLKKKGYEKITYHKQTQHKDAVGNVIYENDVAIYKTSGISCNVEICSLIVFLKNNYAYFYRKGNGNRGVKNSIDYNNVPFKGIVIIGNVKLLEHDISNLDK